MIKKYIKISGVCFFILTSSLTYSEDKIRFSMVAGNENQCSLFLLQLNSIWGGPRPSSKLKEIRATWKDGGIKLPNNITRNPMYYDFNNDGKTDAVFKYDGGGSYLKGTILSVLYNTEKYPDDTSSISISDLTIFPCQFDKKVPEPSSCPPASQKADSAGINVLLSGHEVFFRGRYTDMTPLKYKQESYLLLRSLSDGVSAAVIKPKGVTNFETTCIFGR